MTGDGFRMTGDEFRGFDREKRGRLVTRDDHRWGETEIPVTRRLVIAASSAATPRRSSNDLPPCGSVSSRPAGSRDLPFTVELSVTRRPFTIPFSSPAPARGRAGTVSVATMTNQIHGVRESTD
jgi:hypothetical protein